MTDIPEAYRQGHLRRGAQKNRHEGSTQLFEDTSTMGGAGNAGVYGHNLQQQQSVPPVVPGYSSSSPMTSPAGAAGDFQGIPGQYISDPMAQMAMQYGANLAETGKEMLEKKVDSFMSVSKLKYYFAVDTSYVVKKLGLLLFPYTHSDWTIHYNQDEPIAPRYEINAPDLYIPCLAFVTYILVVGYILGTQNRFSPEVLGIQASSALVWFILEIIAIIATLYATGIASSVRYLDMLAFSGYKYVGMIFSLLGSLFFKSTGYYSLLIYTSLSIAFFLVRTLKLILLPQSHTGTSHGTKRSIYILLFVAVVQPVMMYYMTAHVAQYRPPPPPPRF